MAGAPAPLNEAERLAALRAFEVLDTAPEKCSDDLTRLAATGAGTPIAPISLVDESRQWFKARVGLAASETPASSLSAPGVFTTLTRSSFETPTLTAASPRILS